MAYEDHYRLSAHAIFFNKENKTLFVKTNYGQKSWTLPVGAVDPGETIHETLKRECMEELGKEIKILFYQGFISINLITLMLLYLNVSL